VQEDLDRDVQAGIERLVAELSSHYSPEPGLAVTPDTHLMELGLDSLGYAELAMALDELFRVRLVDADVASVRTVADVAATVRREMPAARPRIAPGTGKYQRPAKALAGWFFRLYCRMTVQGAEHVPANGPVILAANHRSMWDVPIHVIASPRPVTFMAKKELFKGPFLGWLWRVLGGFPVRREISDIRAIDTALAVLERGDVLCLYPEGTRSLRGEMLPFLKGAAWIALRTGAPIVPSGLVGTGRVPAPGTKNPRFGKRVRVNFGEPITVEREDDHRLRKQKAEDLTSRLLDAITSLSA
jgi:1-acyl-sn-glycerol-3-phosphate acyltransferase